MVSACAATSISVSQILDVHLTAHCLVVCKLAGNLSRENSLRLRGKCDRAGTTRYSVDSSLHKRSKNLSVVRLFRQLTQFLRFVQIHHLFRLEGFTTLALRITSIHISERALACTSSSSLLETSLLTTRTFCRRFRLTLPPSTIPMNFYSKFFAPIQRQSRRCNVRPKFCRVIATLVPLNST